MDRLGWFFASHGSYDARAFWNSFSMSQSKKDVQVDPPKDVDSVEPVRVERDEAVDEESIAREEADGVE